ncbi:MAG TPA: DUF1015 family protein, partial [Euzebya sp.]|nr:DUF1015 family protein [Euzebya sp.]
MQLSLVDDAGTHTTSAGPVLGVYRISTRAHRQIGVIADVRVDACQSGRIRGHEQTRTARERALVAELG